MQYILLYVEIFMAISLFFAEMTCYPNHVEVSLRRHLDSNKCGCIPTTIKNLAKADHKWIMHLRGSGHEGNSNTSLLGRINKTNETECAPPFRPNPEPCWSDMSSNAQLALTRLLALAESNSSTEKSIAAASKACLSKISGVLQVPRPERDYLQNYLDSNWTFALCVCAATASRGASAARAASVHALLRHMAATLRPPTPDPAGYARAALLEDMALDLLRIVAPFHRCLAGRPHAAAVEAAVLAPRRSKRPRGARAAAAAGRSPRRRSSRAESAESVGARLQPMGPAGGH